MSPSFLMHCPSLLPTVNLAFHLNDQEKAVWLFFFLPFSFCFVLMRFRAGEGRNILLPRRAMGGCQGQVPLPAAQGLCKRR